MSLLSDALTGSIAKVVLAILRSTNDIDYRAMYPGEIVKSDGNKATVRLDDERLGTLADCRIHRPDGWTSTPQQQQQNQQGGPDSQSGNIRCLVGWYGYNPSMRYCISGFDGNGKIEKITIAVESQLNLGGEDSVNAVCTQPLVTGLDVLFAALTVYVNAIGVAVPALATASTVMAAAITAYGALATEFTSRRVRA